MAHDTDDTAPIIAPHAPTHPTRSIGKQHPLPQRATHRFCAAVKVPRPHGAPSTSSIHSHSICPPRQTVLAYRQHPLRPRRSLSNAVHCTIGHTVTRTRPIHRHTSIFLQESTAAVFDFPPRARLSACHGLVPHPVTQKSLRPPSADVSSSRLRRSARSTAKQRTSLRKHAPALSAPVTNIRRRFTGAPPQRDVR